VTTAADVNELVSISAWVSFGAAVCGAIFIAAYAILAKWWRSNEGRVLMAFAATITLLCAYTWVVVEIIPDSTFARWARIVGVGIVGVLMLAQTWLLARAQMEHNKSRKGA